MNISQMLTAMKIELGIYGLALPFLDADKAIVEYLQLRALPTFSQFFPHVLSMNQSLNDMIAIERNFQHSIYELPDVFGDRIVLGVRRIEERNHFLGTGYYTPGFDTSYDLYGTVMNGQAQANLISAVTPPFTFRFEAPNLLHLYNMSSFTTELTIQLNMQHTNNFASIPATSWESFYKLAMIDVKIMMYGALKHYQDTQTAYGTINLKIDDWASAASDREQLIAEWTDSYHMEADQFLII